MELNEYIEKGGRKLRLGYTTGSCAAAAAKAAAAMLLTGRSISQVSLQTPKGLRLILDLEDVRFLYGKDKAVSEEDVRFLYGKDKAGTPEAVSEEDIRFLYGKDRTEILSPDSDPAASLKDGQGSGLTESGSRVRGEVEFRPVNTAGPDEDGRKLHSAASGYAGLSAVSCAVRKDSGDDPDITNQVLIYATAARSDTPGIRIDGGEGVGRVTKPGLDQPVGNAAINSTPRRMITEAVSEVFRSAQKDRPDALPPGLDITISVPEGRRLAEKTFNPKLGIEGGISILGTSGIVEPMSDQALLDTIRVEVRVRKEEGLTILPAAPGNYGKTFFLEKYGFSLETAVTASNFIYDTVLMAADAGFRHMLFVGHIGKLVKVAGGIRNTHSQYGDHRMEILTQIAESVLFRDDKGPGSNLRETLVSRTSPEEKPYSRNPYSRNPYSRKEAYESLKQELADCVMTDEAINILRKYGLDRPVLAEMTRRIQAVMEEWSGGRTKVEVLVFSNVHGELGRTEKALEYIRLLKDQLREAE